MNSIKQAAGRLTALVLACLAISVGLVGQNLTVAAASAPKTETVSGTTERATLTTSDVPSASAATPTQWVTRNLPNAPGWSSSWLHGVSCLSATSCIAVGKYVLPVATGEQSLPLVATLDNSAWSFTPLPLPAGIPAGSSAVLNSVSCVATTSCVAVGTVFGSDISAFAETLTGGIWRSVISFGSGPSPTSLGSVSCMSATSCVAVGSGDMTSGQYVISTLSGSTWSTQTSLGPVVDVSCPTTTYCLAVGGLGAAGGSGVLAEAYDGTSWSSTTLPLPSGVTEDQQPQLNSVSCWAAASCLIGGSYDSGIVSIPDSFYYSRGSFADVLSGSTATSTIVFATGPIYAASCTSANSCTVITESGIATYIDGSWAAARGNANGEAISCTPPTCVVVGTTDDGFSTYSHPLSPPFVGLTAAPGNNGYWLANQAGGVWNYGSATFAGSLGDVALNQPMVGIASTSSGGGYWEDAADGGVFTFGDARFYGSTGGLTLNQPMVGMAALPDGGGYWLVAADGGIFTFGGAKFYGSVPGVLLPGQALKKPIVGIASTPDGNGYWLVASDGGVFSFGDAHFWGSMGGVALNQPVVGIAADPLTGGYWEVASDGGVFSFGAPFYGSTGGIALNQPITAMQSSPTGLGYRFIAQDGGVFTFGDSSFFGSPA
jgi:hypothetical protein